MHIWNEDANCWKTEQDFLWNRGSTLLTSFSIINTFQNMCLCFSLQDMRPNLLPFISYSLKELFFPLKTNSWQLFPPTFYMLSPSSQRQSKTCQRVLRWKFPLEFDIQTCCSFSIKKVGHLLSQLACYKLQSLNINFQSMLVYVILVNVCKCTENFMKNIRSIN